MNQSNLNGQDGSGFSDEQLIEQFLGCYDSPECFIPAYICDRLGKHRPELKSLIDQRVSACVDAIFADDYDPMVPDEIEEVKARLLGLWAAGMPK